MSSLLEAIKEAAESWPLLAGPGDPNTIDVYWHASEIVNLLKLRLPTKLPGKQIGVAVVECVENNFIKSSLIRYCSSQELAEKGRKLVECIQNRKLLSLKDSECYVVALYVWHGCINMAKVTRRTYIVPHGEAPYTIEMRLEGYRSLRECWFAEQAKGNPWVRYGVSIARLLEKKRGNPVEDNWVPQESPYWDCSVSQMSSF